MDTLPDEMLYNILSLLDVRGKFVVMRVDKKWERISRSVVAAQSKLIIRSSSSTDPDVLYLNWTDREMADSVWKSVRQMKKLKHLDFAKIGTLPRNAAIIRTKQLTDLIRKNAACLQTVKILVSGNRIKAGKCITEVALPRLQELETDETDLRFVVGNSPLLENVTLTSHVIGDDRLTLLSELNHLKRLHVCQRYTGVTASGVLSLLKGKSRNSLTHVSVPISGDGGNAMNAELDAIEASTGRRPIIDLDPEDADVWDELETDDESESDYSDSMYDSDMDSEDDGEPCIVA